MDTPETGRRVCGVALKFLFPQTIHWWDILLRNKKEGNL